MNRAPSLAMRWKMSKNVQHPFKDKKNCQLKQKSSFKWVFTQLEKKWGYNLGNRWAYNAKPFYSINGTARISHQLYTNAGIQQS